MGDTSQLMFLQRPASGVLGGPCLDLDEQQGEPAAGDEIDLAGWNAQALR